MLQLFYVVLGLRAMLRRDGKLAVNIKMIIDGEEEMASPHLPAILRVRGLLNCVSFAPDQACS